MTNIATSTKTSSLMNKSLGDPNVCIAILDGPVDLSHPCFQGANITQHTTLASGVADQGAASQHGTHVASIIFGQQGSSVQGIAPNCRGLILPIFSSRKGDHIAPCSQTNLARAITQAVQAGANVINISGGQLAASPESEQLLANAVRLCQEKNVLIVAAAGNDGCECLHIPAALESVLAVGAMNTQGRPLDISNWGEAYQHQGILALGENILGATPGGETTRRSGTSFATPIVSGHVGLLLSTQLQQGEQLDPHGIRAAILKSALPCNEQNRSDKSRCLVGSLNLSGANTLITQGEITSVSDQTLEENMVQPSEVNNIDQGLTIHENNEIEAESTQIIEAINPSSQDAVPPVAVGAQETATNISSAMFNNISSAVKPTIATPNHQGVSSITPSGANGGCGCGGGSAGQIVYPLGRLGITFSSMSQRDGIQQLMGLTTPPTEQQLLDYFAGNSPYGTASPWVAENVIWTLNLNATAIYAIKPNDSYGAHVYQLLREFLQDQLQGGIKLTTVPGVISGQVTLLSKESVPVISPYIPGLSNWTTPQLIQAALGDRPLRNESDQNLYDARSNAISSYTQRIYYSLLNLGVTPQDRAKNFSATNLVQITDAVNQLIPTSNVNESVALDTITVEKSTVSPPNSDCWDVKLIFFYPNDLRQARKVVLFTIDVSSVMPVSINVVRTWSIY